MKYLNRIKIIIGVIFILLYYSCDRYPEGVRNALSIMTKENKQKFENVFKHFSTPNDSLKLKAAYFLVENMNGFGYYEGKQIRDYNVIFDILANKPSDYRENLPWYSDELNILFDSLERIYGPLNYRNFHFVKDEDAFTEEAFIKYVNETFKAWSNSWSKQSVIFSDFCNYVLPYRSFSEPLEQWREMFVNKYQWIHDSVKDGMDLIEVARILNRDSELKYSKGFGRYIVSIAPSMLLKAKYGTCADNSNYKAMIMRAHGIPVAIDYFPQYGNDHNMHFWNSVMDRNGNFVSFEEALNDINAFVAYKYTIGKVYRKTFTKNNEFDNLLKKTKGDVPRVFNDPHFIDVTKQYVAVTDVRLNLKNIPQNNNYVYASVFNDAGWTPIACAEIINDEYAIFKDLGREVMYLPVYFYEGNIVPATLPFKISKKGYIQYIESYEYKTEVTLTRKYHMHKRKTNWLKCLKGGRFEGANESDFSDAILLAKIEHTPGEHFVELKSQTTRNFKYLRFVFLPEELKLTYDGDGASIAEIEFIDLAGEKISGIPFGSPGRKYNSYEPALCFDEDPLTFFEDARYKDTGKFVGLQLDRPVQVSKIRFLARNDMNSIQPGDLYELFYWDNNSFVSLGKQVASDTLLKFNNIPSGALLWLRNLTIGKEERIFTWENGKQVWW